MFRKLSIAAIAIISIGLVAYFSSAQGPTETDPWEKLSDRVWRTKQMPYGYAYVVDGKAVLIDCPQGPGTLSKKAPFQVELILLTHHHRDSIDSLSQWLEAKIPVRAHEKATELFSVKGVQKHWQESIPLRGSRTEYFMPAVGVDGVDCSLKDGQELDFHGEKIKVIHTPGHTREHLAFQIGGEVFAGDACSVPGKIPTPFVTDWDHWTDAGLKPTYESLRKLASGKLKAVYPGHGEPIRENVAQELEKTAKLVEELAFLKSFERFSRRLGDVPTYDFLVPKEQIASGGDKPWSKVSDHLWITGNTYVLVSKNAKSFMVLDPWGKRTFEQLDKLKQSEKLGKLELFMFSHAHYDHYDGLYFFEKRDDYQVWSLDKVAEPLIEPYRYRAPFLDTRPIKFDKVFKDGDTATWQEYTFKFHHYPGQSYFTSAIETTIDGKKCLFTADNFFHQNQFSGSGGWMGLNRSFPGLYGASAKKTSAIAPTWILAEHGGPYAFNAEDYQRRAQWGEASVKAADAICRSGNHRQEWDPNAVTAEPVLIEAKPGQAIETTLRIDQHLDRPGKINIEIDGRGLFPKWQESFALAPGKTITKKVKFQLPEKIAPGRHVFLIRNRDENGYEACDSFFVVDVK